MTENENEEYVEYVIEMARLREQSGLSQQGFADKLGVAKATVAKWEYRGSQPSVGLLPVIAQRLGCTIEQLYTKKVYSHIEELEREGHDSRLAAIRKLGEGTKKPSPVAGLQKDAHNLSIP